MSIPVVPGVMPLPDNTILFRDEVEFAWTNIVPDKPDETLVLAATYNANQQELTAMLQRRRWFFDSTDRGRSGFAIIPPAAIDATVTFRSRPCEHLTRAALHSYAEAVLMCVGRLHDSGDAAIRHLFDPAVSLT